MDFEEVDTPRHLLRGILDTEPNRSPVTRSTSAEAQHSRSSTRQSARLRSDAGGGPQSSSSSARRSARNNAGALNPQEALKRKLRESTSARISLPVGNRRTTSHVTRKSARISALQDDDDVTPRHILKNILQTEPEVSLLFQEKAVGKKSVLPKSTSSMGSSRPSPRLSDLEYSSMTLAAADQSVGLKRKRQPRMLDVTAFEKRLNQEPAVSLEEAARKEPAMVSISPSSGLSVLELSNVSMATTDHSVRRLRRNRSPRRILNVTAFEKRLNQDIDRPTRGSSPFPSASTTLSGVTLSLKTPHMDARTEKKALQRKAPRHQFSVEAFEEGVYNALRVDGTTGGVSSKAACSDDFTLNLSDAGPEYTTDLFDHATTLYAQPTVMGSTIPITATQDKATVLASQIQRDTGDEGEMSQDEQMEVECSKLIRKQPASYPADDGEEEVAVQSQPEEEDAATLSQSEKAESQTEEEAVEEQPEDDKPVESQPEEDAAMAQQDESESQPEEDPAMSQQDEAVSQPEEDEAESQPEEDEAESQPEDEAESQPEDEAESQPEEDAAESQQDESESQPEEDAAVSQQDEAESQPEEDAAVSQQHEVESQPEEDEAESQPEEDPVVSQQEEDEVESQPEDVAVAQTDEEAHESQTHEVDSDSQLEEETPEEEPESQTDDEEVPEYQIEEEAVPESQSEEEDNGKPEAALEGTPTKLSHVTEKISHRAFRSEGGGLVPGAVDGGRDYKSMGAVPKKATEAEWTGNTSAGEDQSERHSGHVGGTSAQISEADQEDPADKEEWEDEEDDISEDLTMKTPAFIRAIRKGVVTKPQSSPGALRNIQPSVEDAVSVQPKKRTAKTGGQKKKEPPSIFTKNYCMGNFKHFAKTKVSPDVYPVLKDTMEKFFDRMVEDLETYANHAKRKTIEVEDVILLLKRQGHVTDKVPVEVLIEKYLDMDARKQLIPCASSGNVVFPKSLP